ncbi:hypothetical protein BKA62DRAFT_740536 [Auriculariales sp. MPI-PUGE-AT-0066]|nr:hypothetical protein BKA62DRAFT_740536 [Auriculariales sp. MPI-PUGE-AT-0066]
MLVTVLACLFLLAPLGRALSVSLSSNTVLDNSGIYFVSYDGLVNVNSFQQNAVLTYEGYQYAAWYSSSRSAMLARRAVPSGSWASISLPHTLSANDSHNVMSLGISPADGTIHVAMDCHSTTLYYTKSTAGLANSPASKTWAASSFGSIVTTLGGLNIGTTVTYPQFAVTPDNKLQFIYRSGVSGNGAAQLAEWSGSAWSSVGQWSSASGSYTSTNGVVSTVRNLYIHGFTYSSTGRLHVAGTWREQTGGVSCGDLTNHDTVYFYSDDRGRSWYNSAGTKVGTSGSSPIAVGASGIIVDSLNADHALMNQESQAADSTNLPHVVISYVPGRFGQCITSYESGRLANAYAFHVWRSSAGTWTKTEIPQAVQSVGRSQIFLDSSDNAYVVLPFIRIMGATKASNYTDWALLYNGQSAGLNAFGEITLDRSRIASERIVSVLYQLSSSGTSSAVKIADFKF